MNPALSRINRVPCRIGITPVLRVTLPPACVFGLILFTALCSPAPAQGALGDVIRSIPCAASNTSDLAWVDGMLYQVNFTPLERRKIFVIDPVEGTVVDSIPTTGSSPQGIVYDGHNLWQCDLAGDMIYKLDPVTGGVRGQWPAPGGTNGQPIGLGWDGGSIWIGDSRDPEKLWQCDTLGVVLGDIPAPGDSPYGLAWAGGYVWVSDNNVGGGAFIYKLDPTDGALVDSFPCPNQGGAPNGITHDGEFLWVADNMTDMIYQIDDGGGAGAAGPATRRPSSLRLEAVTLRGTSVEVELTLDRAGLVEIGLYNVLGRKETLIRRACTAGSQRLVLDAGSLPSGVHFVRVASLEERAAGRLVLIR